MEGDAGASRLTPNDPDDPAPETAAADSGEATDLPPTGATPGDSDEPQDETDTASAAADPEDLESDSVAPEDDSQGASRLGRGWLVGVATALVVSAGGLGAGGYLALRSHHDSLITARHNEAAVAAAKTCVAATQAPDTNTMAASAQKIIECGTGAFRSQAILYSGLLVEAYQAANAHVQVSDLRAAVERDNPDGSIAILVPLRVKVSNSDAQNQEAGYRLRVLMVPEEGQYRIAKLDQVAR